MHVPVDLAPFAFVVTAEIVVLPVVDVIVVWALVTVVSNGIVETATVLPLTAPLVA